MDDSYMGDRDILILCGADILELLTSQEAAMVDVIAKAYCAHGKRQSSLPHSTFLTFPDHPANRIIALTAYLGGEFNTAGVKWIASFPENTRGGMDRASAVLILNSTESGRPKAIMESSIISARRTAASAALAARLLMRETPPVAGLIGCGLINFEILRFLRAVCPEIRQVLLFDLNPQAAEGFRDRCAAEYPELRPRIMDERDEVLRNASLISFATTAGKPHVRSLEMCVPGAVVLHVSLRDLSPEVILACDNVVDDPDHVCKAQTSIHLAEQQAGNRQFIRCNLADILNGTARPRKDTSSIVVFSPFGIGILDIAVGELVLQLARQKGQGQVLRSFLPEPWRKTHV
jgi:2,3-diaminopropionate biosynthesis protein SbnB